MNEGRPYLQMWREVRVSFCKIVIVCFLSVRYRSDGLYCKMAGIPSSPTRVFYKKRYKYGDTNVLSMLVSINLDLHSIQRLSMWGLSTMTSRLCKTKVFPSPIRGGDGGALLARSSPSSHTRWF